MRNFSFSPKILFTFLFFVLFSGFGTSAFAQRDPDLISSRHYVGIEGGLNYTWLPGSTNFFFTFEWPYTDLLGSPVVKKFSFVNPGSGLGYQLGGVLDLSLTDFLGLQFKLQYREHATSSVEDETDSLVGANGDFTFEKTFRTKTGFLGIDAALRLQFVKEGLYGLIGLGYSALLSDNTAIHGAILGSNPAGASWVSFPSQTPTGNTQFDYPYAPTNGYFNTSQIAAKLGIGTFIPLGSNNWVLTPELQLAIPFSEWVSSANQSFYATNGATPPKMWYATLNIALKFPFGATSKADMADVPQTSFVPPPPGYADLTGRVTNAKTGEGIKAKLTVTDLNDNEVVGTSTTADDGSYTLRVKAPGRYSVTADADGYLFGSTYYQVDDQGRIMRGNHDIKLSEASGKVRLLIFFDLNKDELQRSSFPELERVVHLMQANPSMEVEIAGYTDSQGADAYNLDLSKRRANSVKDYLLKKGIAGNRITAKGYGKDNPISTNDTEDGRADNRRVEFIVLKK